MILILLKLIGTHLISSLLLDGWKLPRADVERGNAKQAIHSLFFSLRTSMKS